MIAAACTGEIGSLAPSREVAVAPPPAQAPVTPGARTAFPPVAALPTPTAPARVALPAPTQTPAIVAAAPTVAPPRIVTPLPTSPPALPTLPPAPLAAPPPAAPPAPVGPTPLPPAVSFTIPLVSLSQVDALGTRPEINDILEAARRYPTSNVYIAAYATGEDATQRGTDVRGASDFLVVEAGRALASRGITPDRISGKGMGANPAVGRAIVVSVDVAGQPSTMDPSALQLAEREAAKVVPERFPAQNRTFKEVPGGTSAYRVGAGDELKITLWLSSGAKEFSVPVQPSGTVSFDLVQEAPVAGLTIEEAQSLLGNILKRYYRSPRLTVVVTSFASRNVTVVGPEGPKAYVLSGRTTILDLLGRGGVVPPTADLKAIRVARGSKEFQVNVYRTVLDHDWKENLVLDEGDVVYVPTFTESGNYVVVLGSVKTPGVYPMRTHMTASQALLAAGGVAESGYLPHARIIRGHPENPELLPADVDRVLQKGETAAERELAAGDVLYVPATRISNWNAFIQDLRPSLEIASLPFRGLSAALLFGRRPSTTTTTTTIIVFPTPLIPGP